MSSEDNSVFNGSVVLKCEVEQMKYAVRKLIEKEYLGIQSTIENVFADFMRQGVAERIIEKQVRNVLETEVSKAINEALRDIYSKSEYRDYLKEKVISTLLKTLNPPTECKY